MTQPVSTAHQTLWIFTAPLVTETSATCPTMLPNASITAIPRPCPAGSGLPQPDFSATASSTARCRGCLVNRSRRNSYGSLPAVVASSSMNASTTNPCTDAPTERQNPYGIPGSDSMYSTRMFGMSYGNVAEPSTEMKSMPLGGNPPIRFISDCCTMRCMNTEGLPDASTAPHMRTYVMGR